MKKLIALLCSVGILTIAASPNSPTSIWFVWNPQPDIDVFKLYTCSDITVPVSFWTNTVTVTTNFIAISVTPSRMFYYVTASNFWGESGPSNITNTPMVMTNIGGLKINR